MLKASFVVAATFVDLVDRMFVGPLWPASLLVCLLILYSLLAMVGVIDFGFDVPDMDVDAGLELDAAGMDVAGVDPAAGNVDFWQGIGATTVRCTNFGRIPLVIWGGLFAVAFWSVSFLLWHGFDSYRYSPTVLPSLLLTIRNGVIGVGLTKLVTQPLLRFFVPGPAYGQWHLVGATCEVISSEATPDFGQAKFRTQAAPLLLNIRTLGETIPKGTEVRIVDFDPKTRIYRVTSQPLEHLT